MSSSPTRRRAFAAVGSLLAVSLAGVSVASAHADQASAAKLTSKKKVSTLRAGMWRPDGAVQVIAVHGKRIYVGGGFTHMVNSAGTATAKRYGIAALDRRTGALITSFHAKVNGPVEAIAVFDHQLFLGGDFTKINGKSRQHVAALKLKKGRLVKNWHPNVDATVYSLLHLKKRLYVGGEFTHVGTVKHRRLFAIGRNEKVLSGWPASTAKAEAGTNGPVFSLATASDHNSVIVGGHFEQFNSTTRVNLGSLTLGGKVTAWKPPAVCVADCPVRDLAVSSSRVYAGIDGPGGRVRAYRSSSGSTSWTVRTNGDVTAVALTKNGLMIGGHFSRLLGEDRSMFAVLDRDTGALSARTIPTTGSIFPGILDIRVFKGVALLGGDFDAIASQNRLAAVYP